MIKHKKEVKEIKEKKSILQKELSAKEALAVIGVFGAILVYGYLFIYPQYTQYKENVNNLNSVEAKITDYEGKMSQMPEKEKTLDNLKNEIKVKGKMLAHNMEDGMFLIGLSDLMSKVNVNLVDYSMDEVIPYDTFYAIPTSITVRGKYNNVKEIMYYMENQKNMTQILDYSMDVYIPKEKKTEHINHVNNETTITPDATVYWTPQGKEYHKEDCVVFKAEKITNGNGFSSGTADQSKKLGPDENCKPYTVNKPEEQENKEPEKPKSTGVVEATFKFMMYSSENPIMELNNSDASKWKPGKFNPFTTTSR